MNPFETFYGINCNTLVRWNNPTNKVVIRPKLLREMEE
jgi:hypothetical protein